MSVQSVKPPPEEIAEGAVRAEDDVADRWVAASSADRDQAEGEPIQQREFDGLAWTFRSRFERVLAMVPAAVWLDPGGQGWQRVKQNSERTVWRARLDGVNYYLKYYASGGLMEALKRRVRGSACRLEWQSGVYALEAGIAAVRPVACTERVTCDGLVCSLLITEAVEPAHPLDEFWQTLQGDEDETRRCRDARHLIDLLAEMIARAHQAGFEHRDMHAANILVRPVAPRQYETVFVDLQSARLGAPLSDRAVVRNLAQLNQWFRRHSSSSDRLRFLRRYVRWRNEYEQAFEHGRPLDMSFEQLVAALLGQARRHADRLWSKRDRRAGRNSRYFRRVRIGGGWRGMVFVCSKRRLPESRASEMVLEPGWWLEQLRDPLRWFAPDAGRACKLSHSASVTRCVLPAGEKNLPAIVKRPLARSWRRRVRQLLPPSRAMRGWRIGNALLHRDIAAARPLAVLERRAGPLVLDSLLLTEAIPGAADLDAHLRSEFERCSPAEWLRHKRRLAELLANHLRQLFERGFDHRDCKAQNILVVSEPEPKLIWIDMDGLRCVGHVPLGRRRRALARLHVSLLDIPGLSRGDRVRFLKRYLVRFGSDPREWRAVWRALEGGVAKKLQVLERRRAWKREHYGRE